MVSAFTTLPNPTFDAVVPACIVAAELLSTALSPTSDLVVPARIDATVAVAESAKDEVSVNPAAFSVVTRPAVEVDPVPPCPIGSAPARLVIAKEPVPLNSILSAVIVPVSMLPPSIVVMAVPPTSENVPLEKVTTPSKFVYSTTVL